MEEDIFDLSISKKENEFVEYGLNLESDVVTDIVETFMGIPYIGPLLKLGRIGSRFVELCFIQKLAKFLEKDVEIPDEEKEKFLNEISPKQRKFYMNT